jgi:transposase
MLKLEFSTAEIDALHYERFHHPHPRVQMKMEVVYLKSQQLPHQEICRLAGLTGNTLCAYLHAYQAGGLERLKQLNFYRPHRPLLAQRASLEQQLKEPPPATLKQARALIAEQTGIERSPTQIRAFLRTLGLKCRKVCLRPAKADVEQQAEFLAQALRPRLAAAQAGARAVFVWMPRTLSSRRSWVSAGRRCASLFRRRVDANVSMYSARSTRSRTRS